MTITTFSSRQFNQDASRAKRAAEAGPVFITDRGHPAHVLLTFSEYQRLTGKEARIADLLACPGGDEIDLPCPVFPDPARAADLS